MMCMLAPQERLVVEWESLLCSVGLRIETTVPYTEQNDAIFLAIPR